MGVTGTDLLNGFFKADSKGLRMKDMVDGTSNTLMLGERPPNPDLVWGEHLYADFDTILPVSVAASLLVSGYNTSMDTANYNCSIKAPFIFAAGNYANTDNCDMYHYWSHHSAGAHFAMADGSARFLIYSAGQAILPKLATRDGGESADLGD